MTSSEARLEKWGAIVLSGGHSARMGEPKALLELEGRTLVARAAARLAEVFAEIVVVAQASLALPDLDGARVVRDPLPDAGPLVGLAAGLEALGEDREGALVWAVDAPFFDASVGRRLVALAEGVDAVVPRFDGDAFPLAAIYRRGLASEARRMIDRGERRARKLAETSITRWASRDDLLADPDVARADPDLRSFFNVNTRDDWAHALEVSARFDGRRGKRA